MNVKRELFIKRQEKGILFNEIETTKKKLFDLEEELKNVNIRIEELNKNIINDEEKGE